MVEQITDKAPTPDSGNDIKADGGLERFIQRQQSALPTVTLEDQNRVAQLEPTYRAGFT